MSCGRTSRRRPRSAAGRGDRHPHLGLTLMLVAVAAVERTTPAAAQLATGLNPPGTAPATGLSAPGTSPATGAPTIFPPPPTGAFGLPNPLAPPNALPAGPLPVSAAPPPSELGLAAPGSGITPLQLYNPNAPAVLIQPTATIGVAQSRTLNHQPKLNRNRP